MDFIVLPQGDRQTLFSYNKGNLTAVTTFPIFSVNQRVEISKNFLVTFASCKRALMIQSWFQTGRVSVPEVIELPSGVTGECILVTDSDELFVGGKSNRPWLGRINLQDQTRSWESLLSDQDLENANEKGIDALSLSYDFEWGPRLIAYDNLLLPLYAWIFEKTELRWNKPKRIEIQPIYTYEHIVSAFATDDDVYLITNGINHGTSMQFLRHFDKHLTESNLIYKETSTDFLRDRSEVTNTFERGADWVQVVATQDGKIMIAAGNAGLGIYDTSTSEMKYLEREGKSARFISLVDFECSAVVAFEDTYETNPNRWSIEVFSTNGSKVFPHN
jgi:hypothetical protein